MRDRKDPEEEGWWEGTGGRREGETIIRINCMRKESIFSERMI